MKTPEQIKAWMEAQPWYEQFKLNTVIGNYTIKYVQKVLSGIYGKSTIVLAFGWEDSDEKWKFWNDINNEFCKWYDEENPD